MSSKLKLFLISILFLCSVLLASGPVNSQLSKYSCAVTGTEPATLQEYPLPTKCGQGSWETGSSSCGGFPIDC